MCIVKTFFALTDEQKQELKERAQKVAQKNKDVTQESVYEEFKSMFFVELFGHLHYAAFHPISMFDVD